MSGRPRLDRRSAGLLVPLFSLPGGHGIGDLGPSARAFVDFLARAGQHWWQMLPPGPPRRGDSPYSSLSAFALNPLYLSLADLCRDGMLERTEVADAGDAATDRVDYAGVRRRKGALLRRAAARLARSPPADFWQFRVESTEWLDDWALYAALSRRHGRRWTAWPAGLCDRDRSALRRAAEEHAGEIGHHTFVQYLLWRQWRKLVAYAHGQGIGLIGDVPLFVDHESADVWANRQLFDLDPAGAPRVVTGVPPDAFSARGQRWGHPHYRWSAHRRSAYRWWTARLANELQRFDVVRLDHFIGFVRAYHIDASSRDARHGRWVAGAGMDLFAAVLPRLGLGPGGEADQHLIAEDLGVVTDEVVALREQLRLPGLHVLQFEIAGDGPGPGGWPRRSVAMTGTHDNDTIVGWWRSASATERAGVRVRTGWTGRVGAADFAGLIYESPADVAILPLADALGFGSEARINTPGVARGNWRFRFTRRAFTRRLEDRLLGWAQRFGRGRVAETR